MISSLVCYVYHLCCFLFRDLFKRSNIISLKENLKQSVIPDLLFLWFDYDQKYVFVKPWL